MHTGFISGVFYDESSERASRWNMLLLLARSISELIVSYILGKWGF